MRRELPLAASLGFDRSDAWIGSALDLSVVDTEGYSRRLDTKTRNMLSQARRKGLTFAVEGASAETLQTWYSLHQHTQRHLGLPPFPRRFFGRLIEGFGTDGLRLHVVRTAAGEPAAACLLLVTPLRAIYAYSASRPDLRALRPNDLLLYETILSLKREGFSVFDMGSDSPRQESLLRFKAKWLTAQAPATTYFAGRFDPAAADSSALLWQAARQVARRLPLPLAEWLLAPLCRYFG